MTNGENTKPRPRTAPPRGGAASWAPRIAACAAACLVLVACIAAFGCSRWAYADDSTVVHVSYQWYNPDTGMTEDYEAFDATGTIQDGRLCAQVMPEAYELGDGCSWRVMKNFAGGLPAGEEDITAEAAYDEATGTLRLSAERAGEDLTIVFCLPWDHASHDDHGHFHATATRAGGMLRATDSTPYAGQMYYLSIQSGDTGRWSSPVIYAADSDNAGAGGVFGYPEFEGRYKFYVAFERGNCELFEMCDAVPGRQGVGGTIYGSTGTPYNTDWAADYVWCSADCVEAVYNTGGDPVPLQGDGSWVRIDDVSGNTYYCTFRIQCDNPDGSNAQDIMGTFTIEMPRGAIAFQKTSANPDVSEGNGLYTLEGARYGVCGPIEQVKRNTEEEALAVYTTDADGRWETGNDFLAGTYYIAELEAPKGFALNEETVEVDISAGQIVSATAADVPLTAPADMSVQKRDSETQTATAQGDAKLAGAEITFRYYDGYYTADDLPNEPTRTWVMRTNDEGVASPSHGDAAKVSGDGFYRDATGAVVFPLGTVTAVETKAPEGYLLGEPELLVVHVVETDDGSAARIETVTSTQAGESADGAALIADDVAHGGLVIGKVSRENGDYLEQGAASLEGWTFEVVNRSDAPVMVDGTMYAVGDVVKTISTENVDGKFVADVGEACLPYGTYEVREIQTMRPQDNGYLFDEKSETWSQIVSIRDDGQIVDLTDAADACANQVVRGDIELVKAKSPGMQRLAGIPFKVTSVTTGEWHVIMTDRNGWASTSAEANAHSSNTNSNDAALREDGSVDESLLDDEAGVWFDGRTDAATEPDDDKGALPFDTYTVEELRVAANEGLELVTFDVTVYRDAMTVDMGTIDDADSVKPLIGTSLTDPNGSATAIASADTVLVDTVMFNNLGSMGRYTLVGELHLVNDGEAGEIVATSQKTFTPGVSHGTQDVTFEFDASGLSGQSLVCFEYLQDETGNVIAEHADATDEGQTVRLIEPEPGEEPEDEPEPETPVPNAPKETPSGFSVMPKTGDALFALPLVIIAAGAIGLALAALGVRNLERTCPVVTRGKRRI